MKFMTLIVLLGNDEISRKVFTEHAIIFGHHVQWVNDTIQSIDASGDMIRVVLT